MDGTALSAQMAVRLLMQTRVDQTLYAEGDTATLPALQAEELIDLGLAEAVEAVAPDGNAAAPRTYSQDEWDAANAQVAERQALIDKELEGIEADFEAYQKAAEAEALSLKADLKTAQTERDAALAELAKLKEDAPPAAKGRAKS